MTNGAGVARALRRPLVVVALVCLGAAACGTEPEARVEAGGSPPVEAGDGALPLPTLPPVVERHPDQFDARGCAVGPAGECPATGDQIDDAQAGAAEHDWRVLAGFSGTRWSAEVTGGVGVLDDTVTVGGTDTWEAAGLVRNGTAGSVGEVVVTATLLDATGTELAVASGESAVPVLRPGEPAPFALTADVAAATVAEVRWSVAHAPATRSPGRDLELAIYWTRGLTEERPVDTYLFQDPAEGPHPQVVFAMATVSGPRPLDDLVVVGAWMAPDGRVLAVREAVLGAAGAAPGGTVDALLAVTPDDGAGPVDPAALDEADLLLWGSER